MQLILLQNVLNLGKLGDKVTVKPGYGRNFLVPHGKAVPATEANLAEFEAKRADYEAKAKASLDDAEARKAKLEGAEVTIHANAATEGKLYGSVTNRDIAEALTKAATRSRSPRSSWARAPSATPASTRCCCTCTPTWRPPSR